MVTTLLCPRPTGASGCRLCSTVLLTDPTAVTGFLVLSGCRFLLRELHFDRRQLRTDDEAYVYVRLSVDHQLARLRMRIHNIHSTCIERASRMRMHVRMILAYNDDAC